jgi:hypothetical protein
VHGKKLVAQLAAPPALFAAYRARVEALAAGLPEGLGEAVLPSLLHMLSVRLAGPDAELEAHASYAWERGLTSVKKRRGT